MRESNTTTGVLLGLAVGVVVAVCYLGQPRPVGAASNDRSGEYIMATGAVSINPRVQTDGVWMLDYRAGKLLGSVIDKQAGKIVGWAEVDLISEFGVKAMQDVHFMMTTGYVTQGQSALYVAETTTGKFGVYTMGPGVNGQGIVIRRHDMTSFRHSEPVAGPALNNQPLQPNPAAMAPAAPGTTAMPAAPMATNPFSPVTPTLPGTPNIPGTVPAPQTPQVGTPMGTPTIPLPKK